MKTSGEVLQIIDEVVSQGKENVLIVFYSGPNSKKYIGARLSLDLIKMEKRDILVIFGPTASGKSKLATQIASKQKSAIINFDSLQVYKDLKDTN